MKRVLALALVVLSVLLLGAVVNAVADDMAFRYGGDIRIREEAFDHIPSGFAENNYLRFRTALWGEVDPVSNVSVRVRVVDEFRAYFTPDQAGKPQTSSYECPDEFVLDNVYLEWRKIFGAPLAFRIGRQNLLYGNGRVLADGTPGDGSRTIYFNAAKLTFTGIDKTTIDLIATYNENEDELAINKSDRSLSRYGKALDDVTESGGGVYVTNRSMDTMLLEAYLLFKQESSYDQKATTNAGGEYVKPAKAWQKLDSQTGLVNNPDFNLYTFGCRLLPKFGKYVEGNFESALQVGDRGSESAVACMLDWYLTVKPAVLDVVKPAVDFGVYYLSGNKASTAMDEGWNPLWSRTPMSDLYVFAYDDARWSNLLMPHVGLTLTPTKKFKTNFSLNYLSAPEDDGAGTGHERGWLAIFRNDFTLGEDLLRKKDKLTAHLYFEALEPGDYYADNLDTAYFARWQVMYTF